MAMTKAERKALEAALLERDLARALRWPECDHPEMIPPPSNPGEITTGYLVNPYGASANGIAECWSSIHGHGYGLPRPGVSGSQGPVPLYATRLDAAKAMRLELTREFARKLADLDRFIEQEQRNV